MQQVRDAELPLLQLRLHRDQLLFRARQIAGELLAFGDQRRHIAAVATLSLRHADSLGIGIALGAQSVGLDLHRLALLLQSSQRLHIEHEAAARQIAGDGFRIGTQQLWIDHRESSPGRLARTRASASAILISSPRATGR